MTFVRSDLKHFIPPSRMGSVSFYYGYPFCIPVVLVLLVVGSSFAVCNECLPFADGVRYDDDRTLTLLLVVVVKEKWSYCVVD